MKPSVKYCLAGAWLLLAACKGGAKDDFFAESTPTDPKPALTGSPASPASQDASPDASLGSTAGSSPGEPPSNHGSADPMPPEVAPSTPLTTADIEKIVPGNNGLIATLFGTLPKRASVPVGPEFAAIKMTLPAGWDRDVEGPGTFSIRLPLSARALGDDRVFGFYYGYELAGSPSDRDAYKAWLAEQKVMTVRSDRQRSVGWLLEGRDMQGHQSFRYQVRYRGKILICGGSRYKGAPHDALGKLRDEVLIVAEQICESIAL